MTTPGKRPFIALAVSVGLNLLLVGLIVGMALRPASSPRGAPGGNTDQVIMRTLLDGVTPAERRSVRQQLRRSWRTSIPLRENVSEARRELYQALRASPYNADRAQAAFKRWTEAESRLRQTVQNDLANQLIHVSPEARARLADTLTRRRGRHPDRSRHHRRDLDDQPTQNRD